jgi:hypothetical protein
VEPFSYQLLGIGHVQDNIVSALGDTINLVKASYNEDIQNMRVLLGNNALVLHSIQYGQLVPCGSAGFAFPPPGDRSVFCVRSTRVLDPKNKRADVLVR